MLQRGLLAPHDTLRVIDTIALGHQFGDYCLGVNRHNKLGKSASVLHAEIAVAGVTVDCLPVILRHTNTVFYPLLYRPCCLNGAGMIGDTHFN